MVITLDIARGHAKALHKNYRTAHPNAIDHDAVDYVAEQMPKFLRAHTARDVDDSMDFWYNEAITY